MTSRLNATKELREYGSLLLYDNSDEEDYPVFSRIYTKEGELYCETVNSYHNDEDTDVKVDAKYVLNEIRKRFARFPMVYVNAYAVSRRYVHPAEGGIYLDFGEPLASIPVLDKGDAVDKMVKHLEDTLGPGYEGNRHRSSVLGGENLEVMVQDHMAEAYPSEPYVYQ
jgi:hypothetical protein